VLLIIFYLLIGSHFEIRITLPQLKLEASDLQHLPLVQIAQDLLEIWSMRNIKTCFENVQRLPINLSLRNLHVRHDALALDLTSITLEKRLHIIVMVELVLGVL
jgi:hypothetical protein